tara:strand:+ start:270 stop:2081 length:1812 start_codon:yes stop_codon:yes gene_type:complete
MFDILPKPSETQDQLATYKLKIEGMTIDQSFTVYEIETEKIINKISRAKVSILGGDINLKTFDEAGESNFKPGKSIEIQLGYDNSTTKVFEGIINKQRVSLLNGYKSNRSKSLLVLECVDKAIKLSNTYTCELFSDKSDSEMLSSIISKASISKEIESTTHKHDYFPKHNSNDWKFIIERSKLNGMVVINSDNKLKIKDPFSSFSLPELLVEHGDATISFDAQVDSGHQYSSLTYSSWDPFNEEYLTSSSFEPSLNTPGDISPTSIKSIASPSSNKIMFSQPLNNSELKILANSKFIQSRLTSHCGTLLIKGVSSIGLSSLIKLSGFGNSFDGIVYVSSISHKLQEGKYTSKIGFGIKRNFFSNNITINKNEVSERISGIHIGIVKQIDKDPNNEYRIMVNIPVLSESGDGIWCRLTHFYTSEEAGSFFIPEIGSEVVVSFISDDSRYPVILGGLYTKKNKPYSEIKSENNLKAIVTREKLSLEFDDENKTINIYTSEKNKITISEKKDSEEIKIIDINDNEVVTSIKGVSISSKKDIILNADGTLKINAKKGIELKSDKDIDINGSNIKLNAKSKLSAKGSSSSELTSSGSVKVKGSSVAIN